MICKKCNESFELPQIRSINVETNPELKASVMDGSAFVVRCPHCGAVSLCGEPVVYNDPVGRLLVVYTASPLSSEGLEGYTCRRVASVGDLMEKVKIFEAGLDDIAIELCKFVTLQELGKDVELKFLGVGGSDGEITMTYPEKGEMQMIAIGHNVYGDCEAILSRNPIVAEQAKGLVCVDQQWIGQFLR